MNIDICFYYVILNLCELKRNKEYYIVYCKFVKVRSNKLNFGYGC